MGAPLFIDGFFLCAEVFYIDIIPFVYFILGFLYPRSCIPKHITIRDV